MHNSALDRLEYINNGEHDFHSALSELNQLKFINSVTPDMIYTKQVLLNDTPEVIALNEYGDSSYWDIVVLLNGTNMDIFPKTVDYIYSEADRLIAKLDNPAIDNNKTAENYQKIFEILTELNDTKRTIKLLKKEYIDTVIREWLK